MKCHSLRRLLETSLGKTLAAPAVGLMTCSKPKHQPTTNLDMEDLAGRFDESGVSYGTTELEQNVFPLFS